jgi:hypothetical protein
LPFVGALPPPRGRGFLLGFLLGDGAESRLAPIGKAIAWLGAGPPPPTKARDARTQKIAIGVK